MAEPVRSPTTQELLATGRWKLSREQHPLPTDRKSILASIGEILGGGRVQKLVVQVGEPIKVERLVPRGPEELEPEEPTEDDYVAAMRNAEMAVLPAEDDVDPLILLFLAFQVLSGARAKGTALLVSSREQLDAWLGFETAGEEIFGVRIRPNMQIPEDCVVLCGTTEPADPFSLVTHSVRVPVVLPPAEEPAEEPNE